MSRMDKSHAARKPVRRLNKARAAMLLIVIFLVGACVYAVWGGDSNQPVSGVLASVKGKINILVLGVDERDDDVGRSDTTFVVTIDPNAKRVTMLSIPRDSRVKIPGHGWDKINHAYAYGGIKLSKATVEGLLGIPIDYTVKVNFNGFVRMIDAIGGVTIDIDKPMKYADPYDDNGGLYINLHPGVQKLNGKTAIEYVRYRDEEGDIGRVARQQKFLKALLQEFVKPQLITRLPELIKEFSSAVQTDMPISEMVKLVPAMSDAAKTGLITEWVTGTPIWIQDVSYWQPDIKELRAKVAQIQGITEDGKYRQATELLAGEYKQSIPREIKVADVPPVIQKSLSNQSAGTVKAPLKPNSPKNETDHVVSKENTVNKTAPAAISDTRAVAEAKGGTTRKNETDNARGKE